ncbi:MAG: L-threonylcarbamoyladenylate synthase [Blastocatellia bacterium]|nr:L-threonylcarbamoyladenylate synthase [Blastocatellia bacterium]
MITAGSQRERAASLIAGGGLVAFRTDTFYGLGADPFNPAALRRLKSLKGRDEGKPILVLIGDRAEAARFMSGKSEMFDFVSARHWPGPLTIVVRARREVPAELTAGTGTVGIRLPDDEEAREFVRICGGSLTATSANLNGEPPARTAQEVARSFPSGLDLIVDSNEARGGQPSTVLDLSGPEPRLVRAGALAREALKETLASLGLRLGTLGG